VRVLGIDYGNRRIGLALSDATGLLARPWKTIPREGNPSQPMQQAWQQTVHILRALQAEAASHRAQLLARSTEQTQRSGAGGTGSGGCQRTYLQDERLSSRQAVSLLARRRRTGASKAR
jgi:RNase H-fold protein (predicted Holliday junction resolvase)